MLRCNVRLASRIFVITYDYLVVFTLAIRIECTCSVNTLRLILADGATVRAQPRRVLHWFFHTLGANPAGARRARHTNGANPMGCNPR
jgi:hypothetical protein